MNRLMFEYGRYFMINDLVEYLCGYLLALEDIPKLTHQLFRYTRNTMF